MAPNVPKLGTICVDSNLWTDWLAGWLHAAVLSAASAAASNVGTAATVVSTMPSPTRRTVRRSF